MKKKTSIVILLTLAMVFSFQFFTLYYAGDYQEATFYYDKVRHQYPESYLYPWNRMIRLEPNELDSRDYPWEDKLLRPGDGKLFAVPWQDGV